MIAALFGVGVLTGGARTEEETRARPAAAVDVERVARRLERVRELEFKRIPPVRTISAEQAREEGLAALDEEYPPERRAADEEVLTMLGLLPEGSDLRELAGTIFGEEVAGFYDDEKKQMTLVAGSGEGTEGEITLAHELTHALEDQHFDLGLEGGLDDHRTARSALIEGTATVAMVDYLARFLTGGVVGRGQALAQLQAADLLQSDSGLPPYLQRSLLFPYSAGARFVDAIGTWGPANRALRGHGPGLDRAGPAPGQVPRTRAPAARRGGAAAGRGLEEGRLGHDRRVRHARADPLVRLARRARRARRRDGAAALRAVAKGRTERR